MHQVVLNLLLNSVQAIEDAGTIRVGLPAKKDKALNSVTDSGRGISPEHLPFIFGPFYTTKGNGTGLGLSLARRIVEDHHGKIGVESELGKSTEFLITLP